MWNEKWDEVAFKKAVKAIATRQEKGESTIWTINRDSKYDHPTQKPLQLLEIAIKNSSKPEDLVIDFFGGSGSTLIACEQLDRQCYIMELDPKYVDVIIKRWEKETGLQAKKI